MGLFQLIISEISSFDTFLSANVSSPLNGISSKKLRLINLLVIIILTKLNERMGNPDLRQLHKQTRSTSSKNVHCIHKHKYVKQIRGVIIKTCDTLLLANDLLEMYKCTTMKLSGKLFVLNIVALKLFSKWMSFRDQSH